MSQSIDATPLARVRFGTHAHQCPDCDKIWECYLVTHCRRPDKFICTDCASKDENDER